MVLISDGVDTGRIGEGPLDATTRADLEALGAPVHTVGLGETSLRDLSVAAVLADDFAFVRTPVNIEAVIRQTGLADRQVDVTLARDGRPIANRSVVLRGPHSEERVSFDWLPDHPGTSVFRVSTPVLAGEALASNNEQTFTVKVIRDRVRVLHLCGRPSWDQRFLRAMLRRDPNVDLVSFFILRTETDEQPWNRDELSLIPFPTYEIFEEQLRSFDLVIFQNFNYAPYGVEPFLPGVRDYVEGGGAIAMIGGDLSFASGGYGATPLADVLPVELPVTPPALTGAPDPELTTDAFKPRLTPEGRGHPVTSLLLDPRDNELRWAKLPALEGVNRVPRAKPGAATLRSFTRRSRAPTASRRLCSSRATSARAARSRCSPTRPGIGACRRPARVTTAGPSNASGRTPRAGSCATRPSRCCASSSTESSTARTSHPSPACAPCTPTTPPRPTSTSRSTCAPPRALSTASPCARSGAARTPTARLRSRSALCRPARTASRAAPPSTATS